MHTQLSAFLWIVWHFSFPPDHGCLLTAWVSHVPLYASCDQDRKMYSKCEGFWKLHVFYNFFPGIETVCKQYYYEDLILLFVIKVVNITTHTIPYSCILKVIFFAIRCKCITCEFCTCTYDKPLCRMSVHSMYTM